MSKEEITLKAELRAEKGSPAAGRLRRAGSLPAAMNRIGGDTTLLKLDTHAFQMAMRQSTGTHTLVTLELDGKKIPALLREMQRDVITGTPIHVDFGEISLKEKIRTTITLRLTGEPEGVKTDNGTLSHGLWELEVECLPTDAITTMDVDVSKMKVGETIFVRDLQLGDKITILTEPEHVVASVTAAKQDATDSEAVAEAEKQAADAEK